MVYGGALVIYWLGWNRETPLNLLVAAIAPLPISFCLLAIYTGEYGSRFGIVRRSRSPIGFWTLITLYLLAAVLMILIGIFGFNPGAEARP
jgi:hypothetical protein